MWASPTDLPCPRGRGLEDPCLHVRRQVGINGQHQELPDLGAQAAAAILEHLASSLNLLLDLDRESSKGPRVTQGRPASPVFPGIRSPALPHIAPVPSGTPGCPQGAESRGSAARTPHRPPGSLPLEPGQKDAGSQEGYLLQQTPSSPPA